MTLPREDSFKANEPSLGFVLSRFWREHVRVRSR